MEIENMIEDFECVFKQEVSMDDEILEDPEDPGVSRKSWSPSPPPARPNQLDLFNPEKHNRTSYSFKNPQWKKKPIILQINWDISKDFFSVLLLLSWVPNEIILKS